MKNLIGRTTEQEKILKEEHQKQGSVWGDIPVLEKFCFSENINRNFSRAVLLGIEHIFPDSYHKKYKKLVNKMETKAQIIHPTYGTWKVSTEYDEEGKTRKQLGVYVGFLDEIAFHLADKQMYKLFFEKIPPSTDLKPTGGVVHISFSDSGLYLSQIKEMFSNRPLQVWDSSYFASFRLVSDNNEEIKKEIALQKLSMEDRKVLGLI